MKNPIRTVLLSAALLSPAALADSHSAAGDVARSAIEEAREQLDAAARRFAELHGDHDENVFEQAQDRAFLGLILGPAKEDTHAGLEVLGVSPGSGAEDAGVAVGDVVTQIGSENIRVEHPLEALRAALEGVEPGTVVPVSLSRDGVDSVVDVTTTGRQVRRIVRFQHSGDGLNEEHEAVEWHGDTSHNTFAFDLKGLAERLGGMGEHSVAISRGGPAGLQLVAGAEELGAYFGVTDGALVVSSAAGAALRPGDVLQAVGDTVVRSPGDAYRALAALAEPATAQVVRQQAATTVEVQPMPGHTKAKRIERRIIRQHIRD